MSTYTIKTSQAISILGSAFLSGTVLSLSLPTIPTLILPSRKPPSAPENIHFTPGAPIAHLTHQWLYLSRHKGGRLVQVNAGAISAAYGYLAWWCDMPRQTGWYILAAVIMLGMIMFDRFVMGATNSLLEAHATREDASMAEGKEGMAMSEQEMAKRAREDEEALGLLTRWAWLNGVKALFPMLGGVAGLYAVVS